MQSILREKLLTQAMKLTDVGKVYRSQAHSFVDAYFAWLEEAAKELSGLRSPIAILLQSERSCLNSVSDGYLPNNVQGGRGIGRVQRAVAAHSLDRVSRELYAQINNIDQTFDQLSEKLSHAVAVLATKEPEVYEKCELSQQGVDAVMGMLGRTPETIPMYNYFCAKLASIDMSYLLMDIMAKIVSNRTQALASKNSQ